MDTRRTISIAPNSDCAKGEVECQCELGREKLLTAPPYNRLNTHVNEKKSRLQTAPCVRELEQYKCPISHILITFKSPVHPNEVFSKVFPANTPVKFVKRKLAKLLSISYSNLLLTKNRNVLKDNNLLSDLKTDGHGNLLIDVFTTNSEECALSSIPKDLYYHELLNTVLPKKKTMSFIAIKFRVNNQNETFTRSYHSVIKIHEIKKNLAGLFQIQPDNLVFLRGEQPLKDRMALMDIDYDKYGVVEVELLTKHNENLSLEKLYKELPVNDVLSVVVPFGSTVKQINVEIFSDLIKKPYLGGYRNIYTGNYLTNYLP